MIRFACPGCPATFTVTDDRAGRSGQCPQCQSKFLIPSEIVPDDGTLGTTPPPLPVPDYPLPETGPQPVEIRPCPGCDTRLSVERSHLGGEVACPKCDTTFHALQADAPPAPDARRPWSADRNRVHAGGEAEPDAEGSRARRRKRWDDDDRPSRRRNARRGSGCPNCGSDERPVKKSEISTGGWITFAVLLSVCAPLCWIGLFMKDEFRVCGECGRRV